MVSTTRSRSSNSAPRCAAPQPDVETRGILLWNFLLAGVDNATLRLDDLADITDAFNLNWRVQLLERLSLRLADPSANRAGRFDLAAYEAWIQAQPAYSEAQRARRSWLR